MQLTSVEEVIAAVRHQREKWRFVMQPPCTDEELKRLCIDSTAAFRVPPPKRYLDLLRITNGFWENGLHVYASRISDLLPPSNAAVNGFVEATRMYRENFSGYFEKMLIFGEDDGYIYALDTSCGQYVKQAYVESTPSRSFATFDDLIVCAVTPILIE